MSIQDYNVINFIKMATKQLKSVFANSFLIFETEII